MIQMQSDRDGDAHGIDHCIDHSSDGLEAGHVLAGTLGDTQNDRTLHPVSYTHLLIAALPMLAAAVWLTLREMKQEEKN